MVHIYFASFRENSMTGWSTRMLLMGGDDDGSDPFEAAYDSVSSSGRTPGTPGDPLYNTASRVKATQPLKIYLPSKGYTQKNISFEKIRETLENRGHPSVEFVEVEIVRDHRQFRSREILPFLWREARAACWGLTLNTETYIPGETISTEKAQELHIDAANAGFEDGAFRMLLADHGLISAKEVTRPLYPKIRRIVNSETIAKIHNRKYRDKLHPAFAGNPE